MKQLTFEKTDPSIGEVKGILRVKDKICYFKYNQSQQAQLMMEKLQAKGAIITPGRTWIRVNLFGNNKDVILGANEFNVDDKTGEEISEILINFFAEKYIQAGFKTNITEVEDNAEKKK